MIKKFFYYFLLFPLYSCMSDSEYFNKKQEQAEKSSNHEIDSANFYRKMDKVRSDISSKSSENKYDCNKPSFK